MYLFLLLMQSTLALAKGFPGCAGCGSFFNCNPFECPPTVGPSNNHQYVAYFNIDTSQVAESGLFHFVIDRNLDANISNDNATGDLIVRVLALLNKCDLAST